MEQDDKWDANFIREMEMALSQCHDSYTDDMIAFYNFCSGIARGITEFDQSTVPMLLREDIHGHSDSLNRIHEVLSNALHFMQARSKINVESGRTVSRGSHEVAEAREFITRSMGGETAKTITRSLEDSAKIHVNTVVTAFKVSQFSHEY